MLVHQFVPVLNTIDQYFLVFRIIAHSPTTPGAPSAALGPGVVHRTATQADVIEDIMHHGGLWQSSTPRAPPDADGLVLELDAAYPDSSISSSDQAGFYW
jgi:hypothetical protein